MNTYIDDNVRKEYTILIESIKSESKGRIEQYANELMYKLKWEKKIKDYHIHEPVLYRTELGKQLVEDALMKNNLYDLGLTKITEKEFEEFYKKYKVIWIVPVEFT